jgi:hypothetical protein
LRRAPSDAFGAPSELFSTIKGAAQGSPSADRLRLYFVTNDVSDSANFGLSLATRTAVTERFASSRVLVDAGTDDSYSEPVLLEVPGAPPRLFVTISRGTPADIWSASVDADGTPGAFEPVARLNSPGVELDPTPSADGLSIYFYSDRSDKPDLGRIFVTHRATLDAEFDVPTPVDGIEKPKNGFISPGFISVDNCRLYYYAATDLGTPADLFVASRTP